MAYYLPKIYFGEMVVQAFALRKHFARPRDRPYSVEGVEQRTKVSVDRGVELSQGLAISVYIFLANPR